MASKLLEQIIARHGGMNLWNALTKLSVRIRFGGLAFASRFKFAGSVERRIEISTRIPRVIFEDYPTTKRRGIFTPDLVWIEGQSGVKIAERFAPRAAFRALRRNIWWDDLDLLYFAGYAAWNYFTTPFLLAQPEVETYPLEPWREHGEIWHRLAVNFPIHIPTHSRAQVFYFAEDLCLRRFDYIPEVFGAWARAAHYCFEHKFFDGLLLPTKRKVLPRAPNGSSRAWPTLVWIEVRDVVPS